MHAACEELRKGTDDLEAAATQLREEKLHVGNAELCSKLQALKRQLGWLTCESEERQEQHEHELEQKVIEFQQRQERYELETVPVPVPVPIYTVRSRSYQQLYVGMNYTCCRGTRQMGAEGTKDISAQSIGLKA